MEHLYLLFHAIWMCLYSMGMVRNVHVGGGRWLLVWHVCQYNWMLRYVKVRQSDKLNTSLYMATEFF